MGSYLLRRLMLMLLTLFGMSVLIFIALRLVPGNIADILVDSAGIVDKPRNSRSSTSSASTARSSSSTGNGSAACCRAISAMPISRERPAIEEIAPRIPVTAKLAVLALFFSVLIGVPLGVLSAVRRNTALDYFLRVLSLSGLSMPSFWLGLLVLLAVRAGVRLDSDLQQASRTISGRKSDCSAFRRWWSASAARR